ncbi:hypothetical protein COB64_01485 [Candidatus Wolfebacteria bacterium]|nr:MAG: hypothetical protein COB64_01485 [Candidatus Wolfebacteria bacterium]
MKKFSSKTQKIGEIGEDLACRFLVKHKYSVIERNFTKKWGEIDIIASKSNVLHFIEVKTKSTDLSDVSVVNNEEFRPEEKIDAHKLGRMARTIQSYLLEKNVMDRVEWQVDALLVFLDVKNKKAKVKSIENLII